MAEKNHLKIVFFFCIVGWPHTAAVALSHQQIVYNLYVIYIYLYACLFACVYVCIYIYMH